MTLRCFSAGHLSGLVGSMAACMHVCKMSLFPPPRWKQMGHFERPSSYLTTNTSRRVNYGTQQTSCFWQRGPGSECLLLLGLCLSRITWGGGTSQNQECGPNLTFPIFDCSLNKQGKRGEERDETVGTDDVRLPYLHTQTLSHTHTHTDM